MKSKLLSMALLLGGMVREMRSLLLGVLMIMLPLCGPAYADAYWSGSIYQNETVELAYTGTVPAAVTAYVAAAGQTIPPGCESIIYCPYSPLTEWWWYAGVSITDGLGSPVLYFTNLSDVSCDDPDSCSSSIGLMHPSLFFQGTLDDSIILIGGFYSYGHCQINSDFFLTQSPCDGFTPPTSIEVSIDIQGAGTLELMPIPAALPLFATGLGAMGLLGWRRKRKGAAQVAA